MKRAIQIMCAAILLASGVLRAEVTIETVPVGNIGNSADTRYDASGYGAVAYEYNIGKYEVTAGQYRDFLNAVAKTDTYTLYDDRMDIDGGGEGSQYGCNIKRSGSSGSYSYSVAGGWAARPVNFVSWGDAARFANWLHNGQPTGTLTGDPAQDAGLTEDGAYYLNGATSNSALLAVSRKVDDWKWAITSEDEWYKAAYYDPSLNAGAGGYYDYPTSSDSTPSNELDLGGNNATFAEGPDQTIGSPYWRTKVGEHENSDSPYGTFDQGGNVWEWNEGIVQGGALRGLRGGSFIGYDVDSLRASYPSEAGTPTSEYYILGFRVSEFVGPPIPPIGEADGPYTIWVGDPLILNANDSTIGNHAIVSYLWDLDDDGVFETDAGDQPFFTVDYEDVQDLGLAVGGMYDIHLKVTDSMGLFDTDSSSLRVTPEPASLSLLALASLALVRRRKRRACK